MKKLIVLLTTFTVVNGGDAGSAKKAPAATKPEGMKCCESICIVLSESSLSHHEGAKDTKGL
jgi:hypothetical protein